jgi:YbbR domain-containing protein
VGAFSLAVLLWLFVVSENEYRMVIDVPIEARNLSVGKALKEEVPATARVRFAGRGRALFKAWLLKRFYRDFKLVLDLERISEEYDFVLNEYFEKYPRKVVIPSSFDIQYIEVVSPMEVHISLDEFMVKKVPIQPDVYVEPVTGYVQVGPVQVIPREVEVAGPKELVQTIVAVETEPDSLLQIDFPVMRQIGLKQSLRLIEYTPATVSYRVDIQAVSERIVSEVPVQVNEIPPGLRVFVNPRTVSLTIIGGVQQIAAVQPEDILVSINFSRQWDSKRQFYEPQVVVPEGMKWQDLSPRNVELVVTKEAS